MSVLLKAFFLPCLKGFLYAPHILIHHKIETPFGRSPEDKRHSIHIEGGIQLDEDEKIEVEDMDTVRERMLLRLEQMRRSGVELFMDGREVLPSEAVSKAVRENSPYMADYVLDAAGAIEQVRFDKVTRW